MDQDRRRCARIELDPRVGTEGRVVAVISVIIAVHFKAWRGLFFSQATVQLQPVELLLDLSGGACSTSFAPLPMTVRK